MASGVRPGGGHAGVAFPPGSLEISPLSLRYRLGLAATAMGMLLLPLLYLALIAGALALVWWHLTNNTWIFGTGAGLWRLVAYLGPAIAGALLVFFMVKPIFARPASRQEPVPVSPEDEPELFAFIRQICSLVGAPVPRQVFVDCQINASARFVRGLRGLLSGDLVLTIGLPLAAGLSVRELAGVLAHEFGHFAQGGAMRLTAVVRGINGWFARVVFGRDDWDASLEEWSKGGDARTAVVLMLARGAIWLSRQVLKGLMYAGHALSCFMMRQMEYDADSYEIKLAGTEAFIATSTRLRELGAGAQSSYADLQRSWKLGSLPADLPRFIGAGTARLPAELLAKIREVPERATGLFDTHPTDGDRIRAARALADPGVLQGGDAPSTGLFRDFEGLGVSVTRHHYEHDLGLDLSAVTLVPTDSLVRESARREEAGKAIQQFFGQRISSLRPLQVAIAEVEDLDDSSLAAARDRARATMESADGQVEERYRRFEWLESRRTKAFVGEELLREGFDISKMADLELAEPTTENAASTQAWASDEQGKDLPALELFEAAAVRRLACDLCLKERREPGTGDRALVHVLSGLAGVIPSILEAHRLFVTASAMARASAAAERPPAAGINRVGGRALGCLKRARIALGDLSDADPVTSKVSTVASRCGFVTGVDPGPEIIDRTFTLYWDVLERVVAAAWAEERAALDSSTSLETS